MLIAQCPEIAHNAWRLRANERMSRFMTTVERPLPEKRQTSRPVRSSVYHILALRCRLLQRARLARCCVRPRCASTGTNSANSGTGHCGTNCPRNSCVHPPGREASTRTRARSARGRDEVRPLPEDHRKLAEELSRAILSHAQGLVNVCKVGGENDFSSFLFMQHHRANVTPLPPGH